MNMPGFNGESDQLFKKAARAFQFRLSDDEKDLIWQNIQTRRRAPLFWYWTSAGSAILLIGAIFYVVSHYQEDFNQTQLSSADPITMKEEYIPAEVESTISAPERAEQTVQEIEIDQDRLIYQTHESPDQLTIDGHSSLLEDEVRGLEYSNLETISQTELQAGIPPINPSFTIGEESGALERTSHTDNGNDLVNEYAELAEIMGQESQDVSALPENIDGEVSSQLHPTGAVIGLPLRNLELLAKSNGLSLLKEYRDRPVGWQKRLAEFKSNRESNITESLLVEPLKDVLMLDWFESRAMSFLSLSNIKLRPISEFNKTVVNEVKEQSKWFLDIYYRQEFNRHQFTHTRFHDRFVDKWNATINPYFSFSAGISAGKRVNDYFNISTGLEYRRILNKFDYDETRIDYKMLYNEQAYLYHEGSSGPVWISDTVLASVRQNSRLTAPNTHHFIRIPLRVEFLYPVGKFRFGLSSGLTLNIVRSHSGYVPLESSGYREITNGDYQNGLIPEWSIGLVLGYRLTETIELLIRGEKMIDLENRVEYESGLEKSLNTTAISVVMRKNF
ncbi:MAG: hypothetical protein EA409_04480 [Saprospirales bacterium]|nr:MAG: hypothetical protein EA409_04480 [Saprospirales bacterium]